MYLNCKTLRTVFFIAVLVAVSGINNAHSQTMGDVLERVRAVKFFEMDRIDVKQVLYEMTFDGEFDNRDDFTYGDFDIEAYYSTGECDEDEDEIFEAAHGKAIRIVITSSEDLEVKDLGFDISKLKKEQKYLNNEKSFIYHDKKLGIAVDVDDDEVEEVILFPRISSGTKPCGNDKARDFVKMKSWFGRENLESRVEYACSQALIAAELPRIAFVTNLTLGRDSLAASDSRRIDVATISSDPQNEILKYRYIVSGGQVIGSGPNVVWDLTGVPPGTYTLTAAVDDGCGFCGATVTKTVVIK